MVYKKSEYTFIGFDQSYKNNKLYMAILQNNKTGRMATVHFGNKNKKYYRDTTGLNLYPNINNYNTIDQTKFKNKNERYNRTDWTPTRFNWSRLMSLPL